MGDERLRVTPASPPATARCDEDTWCPDPERPLEDLLDRFGGTPPVIRAPDWLSRTYPELTPPARPGSSLSPLSNRLAFLVDSFAGRVIPPALVTPELAEHLAPSGAAAFIAERDRRPLSRQQARDLVALVMQGENPSDGLTALGRLAYSAARTRHERPGEPADFLPLR